MKVRDLVANSLWIPGTEYDPNFAPKISVLLPTFRRGKSGLFKRAVESILSQTLTDIELIIIDDASTDGTADQIAEFLGLDGRVSCIRHVKNIGLPAISEYEGYMRARAPHIAFAFDDTMFHDDALEKLLEEAEKAPHAVVWGHIEWSYRDSQTGEIRMTRLGSQRSQGLLRLANHIPNNAVLMPREIIEDVGLYDPHIGMARVCDWDLWSRVSERYELKFVDAAVGIEDGPISGDSLGNTYALDSAAADEWMRQSRNEKLRPHNFPDYDVFAVDPSLGQSTIEVFQGLARNHALARQLEVPQPVHTTDPDGYIAIVGSDYDASITLCFDMLPPSIAKRVRLITLYGTFSYEDLARATCVIFVRRLGVFSAWIDAVKAMGIPMYYFLDDNLPLLHANREIVIPGEDFSPNKLRSDLQSFKGVLLSSENLVSYFRDHLFHNNLTYFPVSFNEQRPLSIDYHEKKLPKETVIAFTGGLHRSKGMSEIVLPAIRRLAEDGHLIHLVMAKGADVPDSVFDTGSENLRVTFITYDASYLFAMRKFARFSPDFMVHAPSETENNSYKTLNPLVATTLLGCILVAPGHAPYTNPEAAGAIVIVEDEKKPLSWYSKMKDLIEGRIDRAAIKAKNDEFCATYYSGKPNEEAIRGMLHDNGGEVAWREQTRRLYRLQVWNRQKAGLPMQNAALTQVDLMTSELAGYRKLVRYSWRHRILRKSSDMWDHVTEKFDRLKEFSVQRGWRRGISSLEISDSLHEIPYREYRIMPPPGRLKGVLVALSVDLVKAGTVGVEIVAPGNRIVDQILLSLQTLNLDEPVRFEVSGANVTNGETWAIRIFAKTKVPVYVYEFVNRRFMGLRFTNPTPFMALDVE